MVKDMKKEMGMISAVSEALRFIRRNPGTDSEKVMRHVSDFVARERDEETKLSMIAAASKTFSVAEVNPGMTDKQIISQVMLDFPLIIQRVSGDI